MSVENDRNMTAHPSPRRTFTVRFREPCETCSQRALATTDGLTAVCSTCGGSEPTNGLTVLSSPARDRTPLVYYVRFGDRVKIGTTSNLQQRLTSIPHDEVLATEPGSYDLEKRRHTQLRASRIYANREWFHYSDEVRAHITSLA